MEWSNTPTLQYSNAPSVHESMIIFKNPRRTNYGYSSHNKPVYAALLIGLSSNVTFSPSILNGDWLGLIPVW
jgi:hypothetical protein